MNSKIPVYQTYNYPDIFSEYFFNREGSCIRPCPEYTLVFVFSGELMIINKNAETTICKGEYVFLRKDIDTLLIRKTHNGEPFSSVFMGFSYNFLHEFYHNMKKKDLCENTDFFSANIIKLPCNPYLESIYISLLPFLHWSIRPIQQIVEIKLMEAIFGLLLSDEKFYTCLFKFPDTSYIRNKQNNNTSCLQFTISKQLEANYIRLYHENTAANIYMEAGYKNVARFTRIFNHPHYSTAFN